MIVLQTVSCLFHLGLSVIFKNKRSYFQTNAQFMCNMLIYLIIVDNLKGRLRTNFQTAF